MQPTIVDLKDKEKFKCSGSLMQRYRYVPPIWMGFFGPDPKTGVFLGRFPPNMGSVWQKSAKNS